MTHRYLKFILPRAALCAYILANISTPAYAGAFTFSNSNGVNTITHPTGYTGAGGVLTVGVCIIPSPDTNFDNTQMELSVQNIVNTFNTLNVSTGNLLLGGNNNIPSSSMYDFESVALHEVGHCIGLAHVNAASESFSNSPTNAAEAALRNYTKATNGVNNSFDFDPGPDGIIGSSDDIRGDDINLHWFNKSANNPFIIDTPVDSSTYSRNITDLPAGHTFAANADRDLSTSSQFSLPLSESIMQQGTRPNEAQRTLVADDVATLKYAMSGLDEIAGTADDYTIQLEYRGINATCDVTIQLVAIPNSGLAFCSSSGAFVGGNGHIRVSSAAISLGSGFNWFFNDVSNSTADTTPNTFAFTDQIDVALNITRTSDTLPITGINAAANIKIVGGEYSINGGTYITTSGTINNNDTVTVRHTSSTFFLTATDTILTIGGISDTFTSTTLAGDTIPNAFTFTDQTDVVIDIPITSDGIIISGITGPANISVVGGKYNIDGGTFTGNARMVNNGQTVSVQHRSSVNVSTTTNTTLTIGGISDIFSSTTIASDTTPDIFTFTDQTDVALNITRTSDTLLITGINAAANIKIVGGEYSINGGTYITTSGTINNNDTVTVRHTSSTFFLTATDTILTIGGVSDTFTSTTLAGDTIPNAFTFTDQTDVAIDIPITSNNIIISGITAPANISVAGGKYNIDGGTFTGNARMVNNGQTVSVQHRSSVNVSTTTNTTLTIGGISDIFSSTTIASDTTPDIFTFTDQTDVALNITTTSDTLIITGINAAAKISIVGGEYSINGGTYITTSVNINNDDTVTVRHTSSTNFLTATDTILTIGGISDTFSSTTLAADTTPNPFIFNDQTNVTLNTVISSNSITVQGITGTTPISVTNGKYRINNAGGFVTATGTVINGDMVVVRHNSSNKFFTPVNTTLDIGGVTDIFTSITVTSGSTDTTPDTFSFAAKLGVQLNSSIVSNSITVSGITGPTAITITGGEYSVNSGIFTSSKSVVSNGDIIVVRHDSDVAISTVKTTTLTIGGISASFSSTTLAVDRTPDDFSFTDQVNVSLNTLVTSNEIIITGIAGDVAIRITNGQYSMNGDASTSASKIVNNGDVIVVQHTSSALPSATQTTSLTIGTTVREFKSTTSPAASDSGGGASGPVFWLLLLIVYIVRRKLIAY